MDPGQDQEPGIVDYELKVAFSLRVSPADKVIPGSYFPGCGTEAEQGQNTIGVMGEVTDLSAWKGLISQVVIAVNVFVPQVRLVPLGNQLQSEAREFAGGEIAGLWWGLSFRGTADIRTTVAVGITRRWQSNQFVLCHAQHGYPAAHVFQLPVRAAPAKLLAYES